MYSRVCELTGRHELTLLAGYQGLLSLAVTKLRRLLWVEASHVHSVVPSLIPSLEVPHRG